MFKIFIDTFIKAIPALLLMIAFIVYGYLLSHGYDIGSEKSKKHADTYFYLGCIGFVFWIAALIFTVYYHYKEEKKANETIIVDESITIKNQHTENGNIAKEDNNLKFCKWTFNIWIVYTVVWVMKLPYTYDDLYLLLGIIAGVCWWRTNKSKQTNEQHSNQTGT